METSKAVQIRKQLKDVVYSKLSRKRFDAVFQIPGHTFTWQVSQEQAGNKNAICLVCPFSTVSKTAECKAVPDADSMFAWLL